MEELSKDNFLASTNKRELAASLGIKYSTLAYLLYHLTDERRYSEFEIKKKNGKSRMIAAPTVGIKHVQSNLAYILLDIYPSKKNVHAYLKKRNIKSNASHHLHKKLLINIDLKDFFPSINFGRVRGLFMSHPFKFNEEVATILAKICCYKNTLPQGAPTSPILSNFICRKLDNQLVDLAQKGRFSYTRYADDITFSTNLSPLSQVLGTISDNKIVLSEELTSIITSNGFTVNQDKTRYATNANHQEVTGLVVNEFPNVKRQYVRHIRAMLHAWEQYGLTLAAQEHFSKYNTKHKIISNPEISYKNEIAGKIGFVGSIKGKDDDIYRKMCIRLRELDPDIKLAVAFSNFHNENKPVIYGEGKTDWKHLKAALRYFQHKGEFLDLNIHITEYSEQVKINNAELLAMCKSKALDANKHKLIFLFDRDNHQINSEASLNESNYKYWGNNVYSVLLPKPDHRDFNEICIEFLYEDEIIQRKDNNGYRLFINNEFSKDTGRHLINEKLQLSNLGIIRCPYPRIIEHDVMDIETGKNKALPKNNFATYILEQQPPFDNVSFEHFRGIFELLTTIATE
ncbi:reverse transcriptase domain-containing protein [Paludibacter jiangxiensis]|uniref:RNA-directed DNA polymerase n=1 Tax=Paludibacter jiangxiensis TaxID=681398 RepID=A0A170ZR82_9BACT|nr:reverse transcriptase domain-containing protein [Paludibacter jiangxiensis]GAT62933.1 RNA-directed DNA polymerase [Paludibacter jiangxiensis]